MPMCRSMPPSERESTNCQITGVSLRFGCAATTGGLLFHHAQRQQRAGHIAAEDELVETVGKRVQPAWNDRAVLADAGEIDDLMRGETTRASSKLTRRVREIEDRIIQITS